MKLVDSSVWLALILEQHSHHRIAKEWFDNETDPNSLAFCRQTQMTVLRLLTTRAIFSPHGLHPLSNRQAWQILDNLLSNRRIAFLDEDADVYECWQSLTTGDSASPKLWMDGFLAALAITGRHQIVTLDRGFNQFAGLDVVLLGHLEES
jgi:toxin-antitoxin system PIN domain toxin